MHHLQLKEEGQEESTECLCAPCLQLQITQTLLPMNLKLFRDGITQGYLQNPSVKCIAALSGL